MVTLVKVLHVDRFLGINPMVVFPKSTVSVLSCLNSSNLKLVSPVETEGEY